MLLLLVIIYFAFISLGLPDSLIGSSWPVMSHDLNSTLQFAGVISMVISLGTVISSLLSARLIHQFGTGKVVAISVLITAIALVSFTAVHQVWVLVLLAVPLGFGGGAVDAALNNFVALHYKSKHMNYLHSFWGVGATAGPLIMAMYLSQQDGWRDGYVTISYIQFSLVFVLFLTLPLWKSVSTKISTDEDTQPQFITNSMALKVKGVKLQLIMFYCYCSLEAATGLWAASFLIIEKCVSATNAAFWVAMYFLGITIGRFACGFISDYIKENILIRTGIVTIIAGVTLLLVPLSPVFAKVGLIFIGIGCAPIYPNTIHLIPVRFGKRISQSIIGLSMASAYIGTTVMPIFIGFISTSYSFMVLPFILLAFSMVMLFTTEKLQRLETNNYVMIHPTEV